MRGVRAALSNLPRAVLLLATALFALSVVGTLVACGVFFWYDTDFWYYFDGGVDLKIAAALLSGLVVFLRAAVLAPSTSGVVHDLRVALLPVLLIPFAAQSPLDCSGAVRPLRTSPQNRVHPCIGSYLPERVEGFSPKLAQLPRH